MSRSKLPTFLALTTAGGIGYYLYQAGGNPKLAKQKIKHDASTHLPGGHPRPTAATEVGSKIDDAAYEAEKSLNNAKHNVEAYARERKNEIIRGIDKADHKIEESAAKAKGWFSSGK
ncbi:unnamed protein product [Parascedosporium putredinis]|uniref:Calcofluor white hypersensitive protein n=1 Tax=Parascedosporium putredinis TaxID=1442378 RepID=A0A9P1MBU7_9PEZI|nr:unnamed protein product [Parascedosporium putredinis]CAI7995457.1 unnamed protein product [Parascedosporium putredinis]